MKSNNTSEQPLSQTFLVCILKNNCHQVRIENGRIIDVVKWRNDFTEEEKVTETDVTNYTRSQLCAHLNQKV